MDRRWRRIGGLKREPKTWVEVLWVMWKAWVLMAEKKGRFDIFSRVEFYNKVIGKEIYGRGGNGSFCPGCRRDSGDKDCVYCQAREACTSQRHRGTPEEVRDLLKKAYLKAVKRASVRAARRRK